MATDLGTVHKTDDGRFAVRFERRLAHPPEKVWRAITEPDELRAWFPAVVDFPLEPGATIRFGATPEQVRRMFMPEGSATYGEMVRVDPPWLLEYTWEGELLRWELSATDAGTLLVFTNIVDSRDKAVLVGGGWHAGLEIVEAQLDGTPVDWSAWDRAEQLIKEYEGR
jgi:uncharacterized protein YndB with AHSA1/START domain